MGKLENQGAAKPSVLGRVKLVGVLTLLNGIIVGAAVGYAVFSEAAYTWMALAGGSLATVQILSGVLLFRASRLAWSALTLLYGGVAAYAGYSIVSGLMQGMYSGVVLQGNAPVLGYCLLLIACLVSGRRAFFQPTDSTSAS